MFVSTYTTYVQTNNSNKNVNSKTQKTSDTQKSINFTPSKAKADNSFKTQALPIDYISTAKALQNKQELQRDKDFNQTKKDTDKFIVQNNLLNAKSAYETNTKMFSLVQKPHASFDLTPKVDKSLPNEVKQVKERNIRLQMVNTYIENDNYYKITA
jgi:hypothetical protein